MIPVERLTKGTRVLIEAVIVDYCHDTKPLKEQGYWVITSRGMVAVNPEEIYIKLREA